MNKRAEGSSYEKKAAEYLQRHGHQILRMNFRCRMGEIDLISRQDGYLVFSEVKYRSSLDYGLPEEAVSCRKRHTISNVAMFFMISNGIDPDTPVRFDVIALSQQGIHIYENAFSYIGSFH